MGLGGNAYQWSPWGSQPENSVGDGPDLSLCTYSDQEDGEGNSNSGYDFHICGIECFLGIRGERGGSERWCDVH